MKRYLLRDAARNLRSHAKLRYAIAVARKLGGIIPRRCNLCGYEGLFHASGAPPRYDAECLGCSSRERQRLLGLLMDKRPDLVRGHIVHFAPEDALKGPIADRGESYRTADIAMPGCDLRLDLMKLDLPDSSVDTFVANHVLEHVRDDTQALRELFRCLKPGGHVLLMVPIAEGWDRTYENPAIALEGSDLDREVHFGRTDHVRYYGADFPDRIVAAGFELETFTATGAECAAWHLIPGEKVFIARKP